MFAYFSGSWQQPQSDWCSHHGRRDPGSWIYVARCDEQAGSPSIASIILKLKLWRCKSEVEEIVNWNSPFKVGCNLNGLDHRVREMLGHCMNSMTGRWCVYPKRRILRHWNFDAANPNRTRSYTGINPIPWSGTAEMAWIIWNRCRVCGKRKGSTQLSAGKSKHDIAFLDVTKI